MAEQKAQYSASRRGIDDEDEGEGATNKVGRRLEWNERVCEFKGEEGMMEGTLGTDGSMNRLSDGPEDRPTDQQMDGQTN